MALRWDGLGLHGLEPRLSAGVAFSSGWDESHVIFLSPGDSLDLLHCKDHITAVHLHFSGRAQLPNPVRGTVGEAVCQR